MSETRTLFPLEKAYKHVATLLKDAADLGDDWTYEVEIVNEVYGTILIKDADGATLGTF